MSISQEPTTEERVYLLECKIHQFEMNRIYEEELFANSYLSPSHKIVFLTIRRIIRNLRIDDSTPTIIHLTELINKTAISEKQLRRVLEDLDQWGLITKSTKRWKEGKEWKSEMTVGIGGQIKQNPKEIVTTRQKPGGYRRCHNCGSKNIEPVVYVCNDCGHHGPLE